MGTSKNYPSPNTPRWNAVRRCLNNEAFSRERVSAEVWRAATSENKDLQNTISSDIIFKCNEIVQQSSSAVEAYNAFSNEIVRSKKSSIVTEFAKRAIVQSFANGDPVSNWRSNFVSELTDYFISRDAAGYFGDKCRNKNIEQLLDFRGGIKEIVAQKVRAVKSEVTDIESWKTFVQSSLNALKTKG